MYFAIDIGGTKVAAAKVSEKFEVLEKVEIPVPKIGDVWSYVSKQLSDFATKIQINECKSIGISTAGPINLENGEISPVNIPSWRNFPLLQNVKNLIQIEKVSMIGDAAAIALSEHKLGAGRGMSNFLGATVSTGVGGGVIINNQIYLGATGNSAFFGHTRINLAGNICPCGRFDCVELYASGPNLVKAANKVGITASNFQDLTKLALEGNKAAQSIIDSGAKAMAIGIINFFCDFDINTAIVGGGVMQSSEFYRSSLQHHMNEEAKKIQFIGQPKLFPAKLERDTGLIGAALWANQQFNSVI